MQHRFDASYPGSKRKTYVSTLILRGEVDGDTAAAKTTGIPVGIGAHLIATGAVKGTGVLMPTTEDIYIPSLKELENEGIVFSEETIDKP
jgi:saccharopine dehydrogenase-like NADP-dependent oxidoreductase